MPTPLYLPDDASLLAPGAARVVAIGKFDGVHLGHQAVLADAVERARALGVAAAALTFDPPPLAVLTKETLPPLTPIPRRAALLGLAGAAEVFVRRFDPEFAAWTPEQFARDLLATTLGAKVVLVGANFRFGAQRAGDLPLLTALGAQLGFAVGVHALAGDERGPFSSTRVREALGAGDVSEARRVLGRFHAVTGVVGHGAKLGRTLGYPTANLQQIEEVVPEDGIYACVVDALDAAGEAKALAVAAVSIGVRPTIDGAVGRTVEAYLLDFAGDLYGARLRIHFVARLREELRFDSLAALKVRIARDVAETRAATAGVVPGPDGGYG
jgi:riboflavin kinase/FMN adenylyltransferase